MRVTDEDLRAAYLAAVVFMTENYDGNLHLLVNMMSSRFGRVNGILKSALRFSTRSKVGGYVGCSNPLSSCSRTVLIQRLRGNSPRFLSVYMQNLSHPFLNDGSRGMDERHGALQMRDF